MKYTGALFLLIPAIFYGQAQSMVISGNSSRNAAGVISGTANFRPPQFIPQPVLNAPYSGEQIQEHQQTLADGTHVNQVNSHQMMYRDSQGRTRTERSMFPVMDRNGSGQPSPLVVEIMDPVQGVSYTLDTVNKIAHRSILQQPNPPAARPVPARAANAPSVLPYGGVVGAVRQGDLSATVPVPAARIAPNGTRMQITNEKLGTQVIDGITVEGTRMTRTIPANSEGNDRDMQIITETWNAPDLHMVIYSKNSDPRNGDSIMRFANLSHSDPDPSLFLAPPDYQIVDETGQFSIHFGQQ
jgi:hypothetical protein